MEKHKHVPVDPDPGATLNTCAVCNQRIEFDPTFSCWYTEAEIDAYIAEQQAEADYEWETAEWEMLHDCWKHGLMFWTGSLMLGGRLATVRTWRRRSYDRDRSRETTA